MNLDRPHDVYVTVSFVLLDAVRVLGGDSSLFAKLRMDRFVHILGRVDFTKNEHQ